MTCPKCHASPLDWDKQKFRCGSYINYDGNFQEAGVSGSCIMRQRDQLEFRVEELEAALQGALTWIKDTAEDGDGGYYDVEKDERYIGWKATLEKGKQ
jgi:hypothetical protein